MRIIKYGIPKQVLHIACDCGCEFELYDNEIWQHCSHERIKVTCPSCGAWQNVNRDCVKVLDGCLGNRCARLTCDECAWSN